VLVLVRRESLPPRRGLADPPMSDPAVSEQEQLDSERDHACVARAKISVRVQASARRDEFVGIREGVLLTRVAAPALDGRANRALCRLLAKRLGVAPSNVTIVRGQRSRDKLVEVEGVDQATLNAALGP
jgi:uncharacterized protein (TIGR00251 family)